MTRTKIFFFPGLIIHTVKIEKRGNPHIKIIHIVKMEKHDNPHIIIIHIVKMEKCGNTHNSA